MALGVASGVGAQSVMFSNLGPNGSFSASSAHVVGGTPPASVGSTPITLGAPMLIDRVDVALIGTSDGAQQVELVMTSSMNGVPDTVLGYFGVASVPHQAPVTLYSFSITTPVLMRGNVPYHFVVTPSGFSGNRVGWSQVEVGATGGFQSFSNGAWHAAASLGAPAIRVVGEPAFAITAEPPAGMVRAVGETATIEMTVDSPLGIPVVVRWFHNGVPLADGPRLAGSRTEVLTISGLGISDAGTYHAEVTALGETITSLATTLAITPTSAGPGDVTGDRLVDAFDLAALMQSIDAPGASHGLWNSFVRGSEMSSRSLVTAGASE
ncbi:MAG: immunoglobulin domain-containing protein [Planctomycetota bacterium]